MTEKPEQEAENTQGQPSEDSSPPSTSSDKYFNLFEDMAFERFYALLYGMSKGIHKFIIGTLAELVKIVAVILIWEGLKLVII